MKIFQNILLVCNFDVKQHMAVNHAVSLARQNKAQLTMLSVVKEYPTDVPIAIISTPALERLQRVINDHQEKIDTLASEMNQKNADIKTRVVTGTPFVEIIRQVLRDKHDLVILAAEGKGGLRERLFGSTSMHLMRKCPCPVWVIKPTKRAKYQRILAAIDTTNDFSNPERESLNPLIMQLASSLAQMNNSELHTIQVWSVFAEEYMEIRGGLSEQSVHNCRKLTKQEYVNRLDSLLASVDLKGITTHKHLPRNDDAPRAIINFAKRTKIDLLVMGSVCRTGLAGFFIGNTAEKILSEVNFSVLTVKPEGFVTPVTLK